MADGFDAKSRTHDLLSVFFGALALATLISSRWNVDTSGPDPFYKGPLIFPIIVLGLICLAALPAAWRLLRPDPKHSWAVDGAGWPLKTTVVLALLILCLAGFRIVGLAASTMLFLAVTIRYLGHRRPRHFIGLPLVVAVVLYLVFKTVLDVWFPTPLVAEWLWDLN